MGIFMIPARFVGRRQLFQGRQRLYMQRFLLEPPPFFKGRAVINRQAGEKVTAVLFDGLVQPGETRFTLGELWVCMAGALADQRGKGMDIKGIRCGYVELNRGA